MMGQWMHLLQALNLAHIEGLCRLAMDAEACHHFAIENPGLVWKARVYVSGVLGYLRDSAAMKWSKLHAPRAR